MITVSILTMEMKQYFDIGKTKQASLDNSESLTELVIKCSHFHAAGESTVKESIWVAVERLKSIALLSGRPSAIKQFEFEYKNKFDGLYTLQELAKAVGMTESGYRSSCLRWRERVYLALEWPLPEIRKKKVKKQPSKYDIFISIGLNNSRTLQRKRVY